MKTSKAISSIHAGGSKAKFNLRRKISNLLFEQGKRKLIVVPTIPTERKKTIKHNFRNHIIFVYLLSLLVFFFCFNIYYIGVTSDQFVPKVVQCAHRDIISKFVRNSPRLPLSPPFQIINIIFDIS